MGYIQDLQTELDEISKTKGAPYNLAAFSYKHLKDFLESRGIEMEVFIATLIKFTDDDIALKHNYEDVWLGMMQEIREILNESASGDNKNTQYMEFVKIIEKNLGKLERIPYVEKHSRIAEEYNGKCNVEGEPDGTKYLSGDFAEEMAAFFVIKAVGAFANQKENDDRFKVNPYTRSIGGREDIIYNEPLNSLYQESVKIHRRPSVKNVWEFYTGGEMPVEQGDTSLSSGINKSDIAGIVFLDIPNANISIRCYSSGRKLNRIYRGKDTIVEFKIMTVPFIGERDITKFTRHSGSAFSVSHEDKYLEKAQILIEKYMNLAMHQKVNVVVFPEFMISERVLEHLKCYLAEHRMRDLLFVVAGSGWFDNNNISRILDHKGNQLAVTYKSNGFRQDGDNDNSKWSEALQDPGKIIQILDYEGVGRISNLICRDVYDERYNAVVNIVSDLFEPHFFFVPAWSKSIRKAFCYGCIKLAKRGAVSITANCCEPVLIRNHKSKNEDSPITDHMKERGICVFPSGDRMFGYNSPSAYCVNCGVGFEDSCLYKNCAFIMSLEFSKDSFESGIYFQNEKIEHYLLEGVEFDEDNANHVINGIIKVGENAILNSSGVLRLNPGI